MSVIVVWSAVNVFQCRSDPKHWSRRN